MSPTEETLRTLHAAHQLTVPFENLGGLRSNLRTVFPTSMYHASTLCNTTARLLASNNILRIVFYTDIYPGSPRRMIVLDEARIVNKIVREHRGGFCFMAGVMPPMPMLGRSLL